MLNKVEAYNALCEKLVEGGNEKYVPDGFVLSLAVCGRVGGRIADAYFLYGTDYKTFSEPDARVYVDADSSRILLYESTREHPFAGELQIPTEFYGEEESTVYAEKYIDVREIAFKEELDEGQKVILKSYLLTFRQIIRNQFESCYLEMAEDFLKWSEKVLGDSAQMSVGQE